MAEYVYTVADLATDTTLEELPLDCDSFERKIKDYGSLSATLDLGIDDVQALDLRSLLLGGLRALYVERDGQLLWGGILWRIGRAEGQDRSLRLQAFELESYFDRRLQTQDYIPLQKDQLQIARDLLTVVASDLRIRLGAERSGVLRDRLTEYLGRDLRNTGQVLKQLADVEGGFDYAVEVVQDALGVRSRLLRLGYPRLGRPVEASELVFEKPGNIITWGDDYDWWSSVNEQHEQGATIGEGDLAAPLHAVARDEAALARGVPLLQEVSSEHSSVTVQATLDAHARADLAAAPGPVETYSCTVTGDGRKPGDPHGPIAYPVVGSYIPGDEALYEVTDSWYREQRNGAPGLSLTRRILALSVEPKTDRVRHTLGPVYENSR